MDNISKLFQRALVLFQQYGNSSLLKNTIYYGLILSIVFRFVFAAFNFPVEYWDERTNIEVVNNTIKNNSYIFPTLNDEIFSEKPPLWYFLTSIIVFIFQSESIIFYRIISLISALIILFGLLKLIEKKSYIKKIIFLIAFSFINQFFFSNAGGYFSSHTLISADLDSLMIAFLVLSMIYFEKFINTNNQNNLNWSFAFIFWAFMTKGPFAFIWGIIYFLYLKFNKIKFSLKPLIILFLMIILPWNLVIIFFDNNFYNEFFTYHLFQRYFSVIENHDESILFYLSLLIHPLVNVFGIFMFINSILKIRKGEKSHLIKINLIIFFISLILLTLMQTKLAWYILPLWINLLILL